MSATLTLAVLVNAEGALSRLEKQPAPIKIAYRIARLAEVVRAETALYHKKRNELIVSLGASRPVTDAEVAQGLAGTISEVKPENLEMFMAQMLELGGVTVTIDKWLLTVDQLGETTMMPQDVAALGALISE